MTIAAEIIRDAYLLAHVINPNEEPQGYLVSQGLRVLNACIAQWGAMGIYVPYYHYPTIQLSSGINFYNAGRLIAEIMEANIVGQDNLKNQVRMADDREFNLWNYSISANNRPTAIYLSKEEYFPDPTSNITTSKIYVYPTPDTDYNLNLILKYYLQTVNLSSEIAEIPAYYFKALTYQVAKDLVDLHNSNLPQSFFQEYESLIEQLKSKNPTDFTNLTPNPFRSSRIYRPWGYGYVG